ncbi:hypothetical protein H4219_001380 [Mycoemilia scoparia]|uniref:C2H2-type domain-containing protein n=1 Tax=Mycoemilia scoparia TaxID=417184 RepID=A0A9W8A0P9_9FUNG|nr:hypothetical protein H4219_001380 [Mycoemilia scoparia]
MGTEDLLICKWKGCKAEPFTDPDTLYAHLTQTHIGRKATGNLCLDCHWDGCSTKTTKRDHITSHLRVHIPLKPHKCLLCDKTFKRPQDLKKHEKTHSLSMDDQLKHQHQQHHASMQVPVMIYQPGVGASYYPPQYPAKSSPYNNHVFPPSPENSQCDSDGRVPSDYHVGVPQYPLSVPGAVPGYVPDAYNNAAQAQNLGKRSLEAVEQVYNTINKAQRQESGNESAHASAQLNINRVLQLCPNESFNDLDALPSSLQSSESIAQFNKSIMELYPQLTGAQIHMKPTMTYPATPPKSSPDSSASNSNTTSPFGLDMAILQQVVSGQLNSAESTAAPLMHISGSVEPTQATGNNMLSNKLPSPQPSVYTDYANSSPLFADDLVIKSNSENGYQCTPSLSLPVTTNGNFGSIGITAKPTDNAYAGADAKVYQNLLQQLNAISQPAPMATTTTPVTMNNQPGVSTAAMNTVPVQPVAAQVQVPQYRPIAKPHSRMHSAPQIITSNAPAYSTSTSQTMIYPTVPSIPASNVTSTSQIQPQPLQSVVPMIPQYNDKMAGIGSMAAKANIMRQQLYGPGVPATMNQTAANHALASLMQARQMGLQCQAVPDSVEEDSTADKRGLKLKDILNPGDSDTDAREERPETPATPDLRKAKILGTPNPGLLASPAYTDGYTSEAIGSTSRNVDELFADLDEVEERPYSVTNPDVRSVGTVRAAAYGVASGSVKAEVAAATKTTIQETVKGQNKSPQPLSYLHRLRNTPKSAVTESTDNDNSDNGQDEDTLRKIAGMLNRINQLYVQSIKSGKATTHTETTKGSHTYRTELGQEEAASEPVIAKPNVGILGEEQVPPQTKKGSISEQDLLDRLSRLSIIGSSVS